ncbi:MAG: 16S rRNA processing protein RimM [Acidimicrobiia bacterium]|nr:16S rRNA processing protein RimM [Acidimicrobiia bacterium]
MTSRKVGSFGKAHGLEGEIKFYPLVDADWFKAGTELKVEGRPYTITAVRDHQDQLLLSIEGIRKRDVAETFRNLVAWTDAPPELDDAEYWLEDLVGLRALSVDGSSLGLVTEVIVGPAQARLVIQAGSDPGTRRMEIPFVEELVPEVNLDTGTVVLDPPEGIEGIAE